MAWENDFKHYHWDWLEAAPGIFFTLAFLGWVLFLWALFYLVM